MLRLAAVSAALLFASHLVAAPPADPQMQAVLDKLASLGGKPIETLSPTEARQQPSPADAVKALMKEQGKKPDEVGRIDDTSVALEGHKVDVRIYSPKGDGPFPAILYIHGGGWVIADLDTYDGSARALCHATGALVVSTDYRHAPEAKFPSAHEDVLGVYQWMIKNEGKRNYDASKIAVVGESAGGNMAGELCLMAKERGLQLPIYQVLVYPVADLTDLDTPSYQENADAKPLNKPMMKWFGEHTFAMPEQMKDPHASLALAGEALKGLPPATIINAQIDPLRDDGAKLEKGLAAAGVKVKRKVYDGVTHEFFGMGAVVDKAKEALDLAATDLKRAFGK